MVLTLEEMEIFLGVNFDSQSAYRDVDQFATKTEARFKGVQATMDRAMGKDLLLTYKVNDDALTAANKHLESKRTHIKEVQQWMNSNPLTYKVDLSAVKTARADIAGLKADMRSLSSDLNQQGRITVEYSINASSFIDKFEKAGDKIAEKIGKTTVKTGGGGLLGGLFSIPGAVIQGIGIQVGERISRGFSKSADASLEAFGRGLDKQINRAMQTMTIGLARAGGYSSAKDFRRDASQTIDNLTNFSPNRVAKAIKKLEDDLVDVLESAVVENDPAAAQVKMQAAFKSATEEPARAFFNTLGGAIRIGAQPFRIRKRVELLTTIKEAEKLVDGIVEGMSDELKAQIRSSKGVHIATGGINFEKGENAYYHAKMIAPMTPGYTTIPVPNVHSNDRTTLGVIYKMSQQLSSFLDPKAKPRDPQPFDRLLETAIERGRNPDAIPMLAQAMAVRKIAPDKPILYTASSGGSALVEEVVGASERAGLKNMKGVGFTLPNLGLTGTGSKANYKALLGTNDPIGMAFVGQKYKNDSLGYQANWKESGISELPVSYTGALSPSNKTSVFSGIGNKHNLTNFASQPEVAEEFSRFTGIRPIDPKGVSSASSPVQMAIYSQSKSLETTIKALTGQIGAKELQTQWSFFDPKDPGRQKDLGRTIDYLSVPKDEKDPIARLLKNPEYAAFIQWLKDLHKELDKFYLDAAFNQVDVGRHPIPKSLEAVAKQGQQFVGFRQAETQPLYSPGYQIVNGAKQDNVPTPIPAGYSIFRSSPNSNYDPRSVSPNAGQSPLAIPFNLKATEKVFEVASNAVDKVNQGLSALAPIGEAATNVLNDVAQGLLNVAGGQVQKRVDQARGADSALAVQGDTSQRGTMVEFGKIAANDIEVVRQGALKATEQFVRFADGTIKAGKAARDFFQGLRSQGRTIQDLGDAVVEVSAELVSEFQGLGGTGAADIKLLTGAMAALKGEMAGLPPLLPAAELSESEKNIQALVQTADKLYEVWDTLSKESSTISLAQGGVFDINSLEKTLNIIGEIEYELDQARKISNIKYAPEYEGLISQVRSVQAPLGRLKAGAYSGLKKNLSQVKEAADAGSETAQGFIDGFGLKADIIAHIANDPGKRLISELKTILGIASPSKVMIEIGQNVIKGLKIGLTNDGLLSTVIQQVRKDLALVQQIEKGVVESPYKKHALRAVHKIDDPNFSVEEGDILDPSYKWKDGRPTSRQLSGTSGLEITLDTLTKRVRDFKVEYSSLGQMVLIGANTGRKGEDRNEIVLKSPEVIKDLSKESKDVANNSTESFIDAIIAGLPELDGTAKIWTKQYISSIKKELGIASPSKVFIQIGKDVVAGFEIGTEDLDRLYARLVTNLENTALGDISLDNVDDLIKSIKTRVEAGVKDINIEFDKLGNVTAFSDSARAQSTAASDFMAKSGQSNRQGLDDAMGQIPFEAIGNRAGIATAEGIDVAREAMSQLGQTVETVLSNISPGFTAFYQQVRSQFDLIDKAGEFKGLAKSLLTLGVVAVGIGLFGGKILEVANNTADAATEQNRFKRVLDQTVAGGGAAYYGRLAAEANKYGVNLGAAAKAAVALETSLINRPLAGKGVEILSGFQAQFASQGTPVEDQERALVGVQQAIRKGKLQAEELYQIIEPLPGAMEALAAATGKTTAELFRATSQGEVFTEDIIQQFSDQLKIQSGLSGGANTAEASMGRLANQSGILAANIGQITVVGRKVGADVLGAGLEGVNKNAELFNTTLLALTVSMGVGLVSATVSAGRQLLAFVAVQKAATIGSAALGAGLQTLTRWFLPVAAGIAAIQVARFAWDLSQPTEGVKKLSEDLEKLLKDAREFEARRNPGYKPEQSPEELTRRSQGTTSGKVRFFSDFFDGLKQQSDDAGFEKIINSSNEITTLNDKYLKSLSDSKKELEGISDLQGRIAKLKGESAVATNSGDTDSVKNINRELVKLQKELLENPLVVDLETKKGKLSQEIKSLDNEIASINNSDIINPEAQKRLTRLEEARSNAQSIYNSFQKINGLTLQPLQGINAATKTAVLSAQKDYEDSQAVTQKNRAELTRLFGGPGAADSQTLAVESAKLKVTDLKTNAEKLTKQLEAQSKGVKEAQEKLNPQALQDFTTALSSLGVTFETATAGQFDEAIAILSAGGKDPSGTVKKFTDEQLKARRTTQEQLLQNTNEVNQAEQDVRKAIKDRHDAAVDYDRQVRDSSYELKKSIEDNQRQLKRQFEDTIQETKQLFSDLAKIKLRNDLNSKIQTISGDFSDTVLSSLQSYFDKIAEVMDAKLAAAGIKTGLTRKIEDLDLGQIDFERNKFNQQQGIQDAAAGQVGASKTYTEFAKALGIITLPGSQNYGVPRYRATGVDRHAGQDYDYANGENNPVVAGISGVVTKSTRQNGGYFNYIDIYNKALGVVERLAEVTTISVNVGDQIRAGQAIGRGSQDTGVTHREIRTDINKAGQGGYGYQGTVDPKEFYRKYAPSLFLGTPKDDHDHSTAQSKLGHKQYTETNRSGLDRVNDDHGGNYLKPEAAKAVRALIVAAARDGIELGVADAHRKVSEQADLFSQRVKARGSEKVAAYDTAPPGYSEHHTGYALDFGNSSGLVKGGAAADWLKKNAGKFGFQQSFQGDGPIMAEPWHFRYVATDAAKEALKLSAGTQAATKSLGNKSLGTMSASWYGNEFHGRQAADGSIFDQNAMTVAHKTLPFGTMLKIIGDAGTAIAKVTDRGPFIAGRDIDLSRGVAAKVGILGSGVGTVKVDVINGKDLAAEAGGAVPIAQSGDGQNVANAINQQFLPQAQLSAEKQRAAQLDADKILRDLKNQLETKVSDYFGQQVGLDSQTKQRRLDLLPQTPVIGAISQLNSKQSADAQAIIKQANDTATLTREIDRFAEIIDVFGKKGIDTKQFETFRQQLIRNKAAIIENSKAIADTNPIKTFERDLRTATDAQLGQADSLAGQLDAVNALLSATGTAPTGGAARAVEAQFRAAREQLTQYNEATNATLAELERKAVEMDTAGNKPAAAALRESAKTIQASADEFNYSGLALTDGAKAIAVANASLDEAYKKSLELRKPRDQFEAASQGLADKQASLLEASGDTFGANSIKRDLQVARERKTLTDEIKANELEINKLQNRGDTDSLNAADQLYATNAAIEAQIALIEKLATVSYPSVASSLRLSIADAGSQAFGTLSQAIVDGNLNIQTLSDVFKQAGQSIIQTVIEIGQQFIKNQIFNLLGGILGAGLPQLSGGGINAALPLIFNQGGPIPNYANGEGYTLPAISAALDRERIQSGGREPRLVVANTDERILNPEQTKLWPQQTQLWETIAKYGFRNENYATGGAVGGGRSVDGSTLVARSSRSISLGDFNFNGGGSLTAEDAANIRKEVINLVDKRTQDIEIQRRRSGR